MDCPGCGAASNTPGQRSCAKCGTNLAPVEPPSAYGQGTRITGPLFADDVPPPPPPPLGLPPPPGAPPPRYVAPPTAYDANQVGRRRAPFVLLVLAALVAAVVGAGAAVLLFGGEDDSSRDTSAEDRADASGGSDSTAGSDEVSETADASSAPTSPTATETQPGERSTFRCWNGGPTVARLASCTLPFGAAGMAWVFPSSTEATCSTHTGADQRATEVDCAPVVGGDAVRFHYSEWLTSADLAVYYGRTSVAPIAPPGGRGDLTAAQVESRDPDVGYKVAIYYTNADALWSVTIYAADEEEYQAAVDQLVMRPFRRLSGDPA